VDDDFDESLPAFGRRRSFVFVFFASTPKANNYCFLYT